MSFIGLISDLIELESSICPLPLLNLAFTIKIALITKTTQMFILDYPHYNT